MVWFVRRPTPPLWRRQSVRLCSRPGCPEKGPGVPSGPSGLFDCLRGEGKGLPQLEPRGPELEKAQCPQPGTAALLSLHSHSDTSSLRKVNSMGLSLEKPLPGKRGHTQVCSPARCPLWLPPCPVPALAQQTQGVAPSENRCCSPSPLLRCPRATALLPRSLCPDRASPSGDPQLPLLFLSWFTRCLPSGFSAVSADLEPHRV